MDEQKLWILGVIIVSLSFLLYLLMGEGSVFVIHDQLDETICSYPFNAKYMFTGIDIYPEMMNGISSGGMYAFIKKLTQGSGIALVIGVIFARMPYMPVYGLSVVGVPILVKCSGDSFFVRYLAY